MVFLNKKDAPMKAAYILIVLLALASCVNEQISKDAPSIILSGSVENRGDLTIRLLDSDNKPTFLEVIENGTFRDTVALENPSYYIMQAGRQQHVLYLAPNSTLDVALDLVSQDEIPTFGGSLALENEYLSDKNSTTPASDFSTFYKGDEATFITRVDSLYNAQKKTLIASSTSENFKHIEQKSLAFERQDFITLYPQYHPYVTEDKEYVMSSNFLSQFEMFDYDNEENARLYPIYRNLVRSEFQRSFKKIDSTFSNVDTMLSLIASKKSNRVKDELLGFVLYFFNPNSDDVTQKRDRLLQLSSSESLKKKILERYEKIKDLTPGNDSPSFTFENYKGGNTSLSALQGKYVYMDIWATWCGPCLAEIPSLKKLEQDFKDRNVEFVSISIDEQSAYEEWKDMIANKQLGGIQLIADKAWKSEFIKEYAIDGIPRFILLNPEGKIISADAKRPSNPALTQQLDALTRQIN